MNETNSNQFYLREEGGSRILYNLNSVDKIVQLQEKVIFYLKNEKSFTEVFEDINESEEYIKYVISSINHSSKIISKALFYSILKEIEKQDY